MTYCLDSKDQFVRKAESSIARHSDDTAFAYYYQKHGERDEYVNIQYAISNGLNKPDSETVHKYYQEMTSQCECKKITYLKEG